MNKSIFILVFLVLVSSVVAQDYVREIVETNKYTTSGTVVNEYNEGKFPIDKGISGVFRFEIDDPVEKEYSIIFEKESGERYTCVSHILSNANTTIYDSCNVKVNDTGKYYGTVHIDDEIIYVEGFEVTDALPSGFSIFLAVLGVVLIILALWYNTVLWIPAILVFLTSFILILFEYKYMIGDALFVGILSFMFIGLLAGFERVLRELL